MAQGRNFVAAATSALDDFLAAAPETATRLGDHRFDGEIEDLSLAGLAATAQRFRRHRDALATVEG
ncbi:MAG TPA: hypothetical protein VMD59_12670, partial [Acidimicrobiales bacterium]|nr:hypothetical protein [Acidimicrobiales bacterium]